MGGAQPLYTGELVGLDVRFQREWFLLLGSLFVAGALYGHYMGHSALLVEIVMMGIGVGMALYAAKAISEKKVEDENGILFRIVARFFRKEDVAVVISTAGFGLLLAWSIWKILFIRDTSLHLEDFIVTLFGVSLVLYNTTPTKLHDVQDFSVFYLLFLTIVFVIIWKTYSLVTGDSASRITAYSEYYVVTAPVTFIMNLLGFQVESALNSNGPGLTNIIEYEHGGAILKLGIGAGCSGLYSAGLFFSAFLSFVLVRYQRFDMPMAAALGIGLAVTWLSNIIRMVFTIATGIAWGHPALAFVHSYIGIIIFVVFITIFWLVIVRWLDKMYAKREKGAQAIEPEKDKAEETVTP